MFSGFMTDAWIVGSIVGVIAGVVGFFVVLRGAAFAAHAIPNGAFAGAAAAGLVGVSSLTGLTVFALGAAVAIGTLGRRARHDVATALTLVVLLSLGSVFLSRSGQYEPELYSLLFGEVLGVSSQQVLPIALLGVGAVGAVVTLYRPLLLSSVAPEVAEARGVRQYGMELAFLVVLALATAMTVPVVGALLIFSLMIGPPAAARSVTSRPLSAMALSVVLALVTVWAAIAFSWFSDWPIGFFVGTLSAVAYGVGRVWTTRRTRRPAVSVRPAPVP
jgi:zinc/manganese transport system permease protein